MKTEIVKIFYNGLDHKVFASFPSLEAAHGENPGVNFTNQVIYKDIDDAPPGTAYLHLIEYLDDEHYNDLYFFSPYKVGEKVYYIDGDESVYFGKIDKIYNDRLVVIDDGRGAGGSDINVSQIIKKLKVSKKIKIK